MAKNHETNSLQENSKVIEIAVENNEGTFEPI